MLKTATKCRVIYGDTDRMGVVYYANHLRWFEIGRTEFLRELGLPYSLIEARGLHFPVTEVSCRYIQPARYDDTLLIETELKSLKRATLVFAYTISRIDDRAALAAGWTQHACVTSAGEVARIPPEFASRLAAARREN
jgi:acyl-CoA thioester hydrolase